jgi:hypothetical protein
MSVTSFDSFEDLSKHLCESNKQAKSLYEQMGKPTFKPEQKYKMIVGDIVIYGEFVDALYGSWPDGRPSDPIDAQEYDYIEESNATNAERGFFYVRAYSSVVPEGEYGTVHVSNIITITEKEFDNHMKNMEWGSI